MSKALLGLMVSSAELQVLDEIRWAREKEAKLAGEVAVLQEQNRQLKDVLNLGSTSLTGDPDHETGAELVNLNDTGPIIGALSEKVREPVGASA